MTGKTDRAGGQIVVGVDGTAASAGAVCWAVREARFRRASVHLIFVHDRDRFRPAPYAGQSGAPRPDEDNAGVTALLAAEKQAAQILPPERLSSELADGSPAKVLIDRSAGAELLVLGAAYAPRQCESEAPPAIGPVARVCLRSAGCPVVVVGPYSHRSPADVQTARTPRNGESPGSLRPPPPGYPGRSARYSQCDILAGLIGGLGMGRAVLRSGRANHRASCHGHCGSSGAPPDTGSCRKPAARLRPIPPPRAPSFPARDCGFQNPS